MELKKLTLLCITVALSFASQPFAQAIDYGYEILYPFKGGTTDGSNPVGSVTFDSNGDLLGTTAFGGQSATGPFTGVGTIFRLTASSGFTAEEIVHFFGSEPSQPNDGIRPLGTLILDNSGKSPGVLFGVTQYGGTNSQGTAFSLSPSSTSDSSPTYSKTLLNSFGNAQGTSVPSYSLLMDSAGNLFGSAWGRTGNAGAVFELLASSSYTPESVPFSFNTTDRAQPSCALIFDAAGDIWGTTQFGGTHDQGTVFKLFQSSGFTEQSFVYSFGENANDGKSPQAGLIIDASGNLYGTTVNGGTAGNGTVYKLTPQGGSYTETALYNFDQPNDGQHPFASLIFDATGDLLGTTYGGGIHDQGTVFSLTAASGYTKEGFVYNFGNQANDGATPLAELTADPSGSGKFYGTTPNGGVGNNGIVFALIPTPTPIPTPTF